MSITSTQKPIAFMRDLVNHLQIRFPAGAAGLNTFTQYFDAAGMPGVIISHNGTVTTGNPVVLVKISQINAVSPDIFGNPLLAYTPLQCLIGWELGLAGNETLVTTSNLLTVLFEAIKTGIQQVYFEAANGSGVTDATVGTPATIPAVAGTGTQIDSLDELYWPTKNP
jgi:hypothetical protein